jgi:predicted negative regulator of RcsB-dependent stress response
MLKNKIWTNPLIKNYKNIHELRLARSQMQHKNQEHVFEILNTIKTICGDNHASSCQFPNQEI